MGLTDEQRVRLNGLIEDNRKRRMERAVSRIKEQMSAEIAGFAGKYSFADRETAERLQKFLNDLPTNRIGRIDFDRLTAHRKFSTKNTDTRGREVWFCSLCGSEEIFEVFVKGRLSDFLADYDDWYFYGAYMLLAYEDLGGFVYIDDNGDMTEAFI